MADEKAIIAELVKTVPVYQDLAQPAVKEIGAVAGRVTRLALAPLRAIAFGGEQLEDFLLKKVAPHLQDVPEERIQQPDAQVAVPLLTSVTFTQDEELREMFAKLLAASMDSATASTVHPAFAHIPAQMTPDDARVFSLLATDRTLRFHSLHQIALTAECYLGNVAIALSNLGRMQLLNQWFERTGEYLPEVKMPSLVLQVSHDSERAPVVGVSEPNVRYVYTFSVYSLTDFGAAFLKICVGPLGSRKVTIVQGRK